MTDKYKKNETNIYHWYIKKYQHILVTDKYKKIWDKYLSRINIKNK